MSRSSTFERLRGCPQCGSDDIRPVTTVSPSLAVFRCGNCPHQWADRGLADD